jgi:hypothetical protein
LRNLVWLDQESCPVCCVRGGFIARPRRTHSLTRDDYVLMSPRSAQLDGVVTAQQQFHCLLLAYDFIGQLKLKSALLAVPLWTRIAVFVHRVWRKSETPSRWNVKSPMVSELITPRQACNYDRPIQEAKL